MSKLLRANFICLWKNMTFWVCMAGVVFTACSLAMLEFTISSPDANLFEGAIVVSIFLFLTICSIIGIEYGDGTIRNKVIVGHSRGTIYLANLIVCMAASMIMYFIYILLILISLKILPWKFEMSVQGILLGVLCSCGAIMAYSAIFVLISMLVGNRAQSLAVCLLLASVMMVEAVKIDNALLQPEYRITSAESYVDENGEDVEYVNTEKNPTYVGGTKRRVYLFLQDFLPSCQLWNLMTTYEEGGDVTEDTVEDAVEDASENEQPQADAMAKLLYSLLLLVGTTSFGIAVFYRKNLK